MRLRSDTEFKTRLVPPEKALPGRLQAIPTAERHRVFGTPLKRPTPEGMAEILLAAGCFWGVERVFWTTPGVVHTAAGYAGGLTPNPSYDEVCSGRTGHAEAVRVVFDPSQISLEALLKVFWEAHDPTQGMRQGADIGTPYRSAIYWVDETQRPIVEASAAAYAKALFSRGKALFSRGKAALTTELRPAAGFYYAEADHQQYLAQHPDGYCGLKGTGVTCPLPGEAP